VTIQFLCVNSLRPLKKKEIGFRLFLFFKRFDGRASVYRGISNLRKLFELP
jgi:hypothetical protein